MCLISSILLAFSASLDSLIIGIAYGIKKIRIKLSIYIIIALIVPKSIDKNVPNVTIKAIIILIILLSFSYFLA